MPTRILIGRPHRSADSMTGPGPAHAIDARFVYDRADDASTPIGVLWRVTGTDGQDVAERYVWQPGTPMSLAPPGTPPAATFEHVDDFRRRLGEALDEAVS